VLPARKETTAKVTNIRVTGNPLLAFSTIPRQATNSSLFTELTFVAPAEVVIDGASSVLPPQVAVLALPFMEKLRFGLCPPNADNHAAAGRPRAPYFALAETNSGRSHLMVSKSEEVAA